MKLVDLTGKKYGRWTVLGKSEAVSSNTRWHCQCECGTISEIVGGSLKNGISTSCGCLRKELLLRRNTTHGLSTTTEYLAWQAMHRRCTDPTHKGYKWYASRGIGVCPEWGTFERFLEDMGNKPPGTSLDRKDNNLGYCKSNCRWATKLEQANNMSSNVHYTVAGVTQTQAEWARSLGITRSALASRIKSGMSIEKACTMPKKGKINH